MGLTQREIESLNEKMQHNSKSSIFDIKHISSKEREHIRREENKKLYWFLAFFAAVILWVTSSV